MRIFTAEAILLDVVDLHEQDRVVTFLTREHGKKRGVARGARRRHARFAGQLQVLAKVQVTWVEKEGRELVRLSSVEMVRAAPHVLADLETLLVASCLAEHVGVFAQEDEPREPLYRLLDAAIVALGEGASRPLVARYVEAWVLRLEGLFPSPRECPACGEAYDVDGGAAWLVDDAGLVCGRCGRDRGAPRVSPAAVELLRRFGREGIAAVAAAPPPDAVVAELERVCGRIRRHFLGHELRSYGVLQQTLG